MCKYSNKFFWLLEKEEGAWLDNILLAEHLKERRDYLEAQGFLAVEEQGGFLPFVGDLEHVNCLRFFGEDYISRKRTPYHFTRDNTPLGVLNAMLDVEEEGEYISNIPSKSCSTKDYDYESLISILNTDYGMDLSYSFMEESTSDYGRVTAFKDSVVTIEGLQDVQVNELIYFSGGASGLALNLEYACVKGLVFGGPKSVKTGENVWRSFRVMQVGVGATLLGRVVNPLGVALDRLGALSFMEHRIVERKAPGVITRKKVSQPLETGIKVIDALVPVGRGQRELILGDRKTGKTTIAIDTIMHQKSMVRQFKDPVFCVYVAIGKRMSEIVRIVKMLKDKDAMFYTIVVVAQSSDPASMQYIAPYSACTMAEYFTYNGGHSLIVYDDLSKHADVYRQLSLLLRRPVGREAYPGDVFYLHSRLLERAVKMNEDYKGGSLTALPIVETVQGDVSAYIPTNIISITDGQIYLDLNKHQEGVRPAIDPGISVSRVGSSAQCKSMKKLAGSLKLELAQYREVEQFSKFGSELDAVTKKILSKGKLFVEILKQPRNTPLEMYKQIMLLYAATSNFLDILEQDNVTLDEYQASLFFFLDNSTAFHAYKVSIESTLNNLVLNFLLEIHYNFWLHSDITNFVIQKSTLWAGALTRDPFSFGYTRIL